MVPLEELEDDCADCVSEELLEDDDELEDAPLLTALAAAAAEEGAFKALVVVAMEALVEGAVWPVARAAALE